MAFTGVVPIVLSPLMLFPGASMLTASPKRKRTRIKESVTIAFLSFFAIVRIRIVAVKRIVGKSEA